MTYQAIRMHRLSGTATITLNRPESGNAMNLQMLSELSDAMAELDEDRATQSVVITGEDRMFCAGGDLAAFGDDIERLPGDLKRMTMHLHAAIARIVRMDAPVIAAVNGSAAGAGMSLAAACDIIFASRSATFTMAYSAAGLSPDGGASWVLPRRLGEHRCRDLMLTNRRLAASEAENWGLVSRVFDDRDKTLAEAQLLSQRFAAGPTRSFGAIKTLLSDTYSTGLETQMEKEARTISETARTGDAAEGITAFLNKRQPQFQGQ